FDWPPPETRALALAPPPGPAILVAAVAKNTKLMAEGCDVGPWRTVQGLRVTAGGANHSFDVTKDEPVLTVAVDGNGGAPKVTLHGPGGRTVAAPDTGGLRTPTAIAGRSPSQKVTYFVLAKPPKGHW